jgi:hypothetical protein
MSPAASSSLMRRPGPLVIPFQPGLVVSIPDTASSIFVFSSLLKTSNAVYFLKCSTAAGSGPVQVASVLGSDTVKLSFLLK